MIDNATVQQKKFTPMSYLKYQSIKSFRRITDYSHVESEHATRNSQVFLIMRRLHSWILERMRWTKVSALSCHQSRLLKKLKRLWLNIDNCLLLHSQMVPHRKAKLVEEVQRQSF